MVFICSFLQNEAFIVTYNWWKQTFVNRILTILSISILFEVSESNIRKPERRNTLQTKISLSYVQFQYSFFGLSGTDLFV